MSVTRMADRFINQAKVRLGNDFTVCIGRDIYNAMLDEQRDPNLYRYGGEPKIAHGRLNFRVGGSVPRGMLYAYRERV